VIGEIIDQVYVLEGKIEDKAIQESIIEDYMDHIIWHLTKIIISFPSLSYPLLSVEKRKILDQGIKENIHEYKDVIYLSDEDI